MNDSEVTANGRRRFLQTLAVAGVASAAAVAPVARADASAETAQDEKARKGYRETAHVRAYYRSARF